MNETQSEQFDRLRLMADGDPTWDLSPNDCKAIRAAMEVINKLPETADHVRVVPGMMLFIRHRTGADFIEQCEVAGVFRYKVIWTKPDHHGYAGAKLTMCYSIPAAVEAAEDAKT